MRSEIRPWLRGVVSIVVALGAALAGLAGADGQGTDCRRLRAAIQAADQGDHEAGSWGKAAQRQRAEIDRTQLYADQLGCDDGGLFGHDRSPQCDAVMDRLHRMQDNLADLDARQRSGADDGGDRKDELVARYNATCVGVDGGVSGGNPANLPQGGDGGFLSDDGQNPVARLTEPVDPGDLSNVPLNGDIMDGSGGSGPSRGQAICVRTCDGGYFPLSPRATEGQLDGLDRLCQASCPNTEAKLYTMPHDDELASATALDGTGYTALPAAFKFEKSFVPACTCKPPNQSWVEALAQAETLLSTADRHDITVTAALSDQMAKPGASPPVKGKLAKSAKAPAKLPAASVAAGPDVSTVLDGEKALQAPTASEATTGIGGPLAPARVVREGDGPTISVAGPDGTKKQIRLVGP